MRDKIKYSAMISAIFFLFAVSGCDFLKDRGNPHDPESDNFLGDFSDSIVTIAAIPGVVVPVLGATPVTTAIDTLQYTGTIIWSPAHNPFAALTIYTANIVLTAKAEWTFAGVTANFFTVAGAAIVTNPADSGDVTAVFSATAAANITAADVTGFVTPVTGVTKQTVGTLTAGAATYTITSLTWSPVTSPYSAETVYTGTVVLTSTAGYKFTAITPTVNAGTPSAGTVDGGDVSGNTLNFTVTFPETLPATGMTIGDDRGGGKIAYILELGDPGYDAAVQHGLIAAAADQSTGIIWAIAAYQSIAVTGTLTTLGSGSANTDKIIAQNGAGNTYAAGLARAYNGGGYTDWYLPSQVELNKLYLNKVAVSGFSNVYYWSSSEDDAAGAWCQLFSDGYQGSSGKTYTARVRAVRAF